MSWILVALASCCELGFTVCMKLSDGFKHKGYTVLTILISALGIYLLGLATRDLPLGVAYAVWTGLGTLFTVTFGILVFKEGKSPAKLFFLGMILVGVVGLRLAS